MPRADHGSGVQACARLLSHHNRSQRVLEALPQSAEACARWLARYPADDKIGWLDYDDGHDDRHDDAMPGGC